MPNIKGRETGGEMFSGRSKLVADPGMEWESGKTWTHSQGLSCAFRQWRAKSHCRFLHGYALQVSITFRVLGGLDDNGWVQDFGGLKEVKEAIAATFDHKTVVARDDPHFEYLYEGLHKMGVIDMVELDHVGCEAFAKHIYHLAKDILFKHTHNPTTIYIQEVEVREHESNFARYRCK